MLIELLKFIGDLPFPVIVRVYWRPAVPHVAHVSIELYKVTDFVWLRFEWCLTSHWNYSIVDWWVSYSYTLIHVFSFSFSSNFTLLGQESYTIFLYKQLVYKQQNSIWKNIKQLQFWTKENIGNSFNLHFGKSSLKLASVLCNLHIAYHCG